MRGTRAEKGKGRRPRALRAIWRALLPFWCSRTLAHAKMGLLRGGTVRHVWALRLRAADRRCPSVALSLGWYVFELTQERAILIVINFSHPLTAAQVAQIEELTQQPLTQVIALAVHFDDRQPFAAQVEALLTGVPLSISQWQSEAILLMLPSLNWIAALLLAALHGRMGFFPAVVRLRAVDGQIPRRYEVAEIVDLQGVRDHYRRKLT